MKTSEIVYLTGVVNGKTIVFEKRGGAYYASIPKASSGIYNVSLTAKDEAGNSKDYAPTFKYILDFITNRGPGTYYNASDLNRVENAVSVIALLLNSLGYATSLTTRAWTVGEFPSVSQMTRYLSNVKALKDAFFVFPDTPKLPNDMNKLTYQGANNIERILFDIYRLICNTVANFAHCGELFCGEDDYL